MSLHSRHIPSYTLVVLGVLVFAELSITILMQLGLLSPFLQSLFFPYKPVAEVSSPSWHYSAQAVAIPDTTPVTPLADVPITPDKALYIEIVESCNEAYIGTCVRARSGPGKEFPVISKLRKGMVLKVASTTVSTDGSVWYKIMFDEWLRYPERVTKDWYVAKDVTEARYEMGAQSVAEGYATGTKKIIVDRGEQQLYAYDGEVLFMHATTSTGLELTPTPRGTFHIFKKIPTRYMQGPLPYLSDQQLYDLPGVPWTLYFTEMGAAIHGAYWHNDFGNRHSHGCVNLPVVEAKALYDWAELGTTVVVKD